MHKKYQLMVHQEIPITQKMQWKIAYLTPFEITAKVNLKANINIHGTGFAGSIYSTGMATGWTLLKCWQDNQQDSHQLVAGQANIRYLQPIMDDFECRAKINLDSVEYQRFIKQLHLKKASRFNQTIEILCKKHLCAILKVDFFFKSEI